MSNHHTEPGQSGLIASGIIFILMCVAMFFALQGKPTKTNALTPSLQQTFQWPELNLDAKKLATSRATFFGTPLTKAKLDTPKVKAFLEHVYTQNNHMFATAPIPSKTVKELTALFQINMNSALEELPRKKDYGQLIEAIIPTCNTQLAILQGDVKAGKLSMKLATTDPDINTYAIYRKSCGNLLAALQQYKLVDEKAQWTSEDGIVLASLIQRYRWSLAAAPAITVTASLAPDDTLSIIRWRIESNAFSTENRLQFLSKAQKQQLPYNQLKAQALIYQDAKDWIQTKKHLRLYAMQFPKYKVLVQKWMSTMPATPPPKPPSKRIPRKKPTSKPN